MDYAYNFPRYRIQSRVKLAYHDLFQEQPKVSLGQKEYGKSMEDDVLCYREMPLLKFMFLDSIC